MEKEPVLVLVTMQHACARLIREGVDLALREGRPVKVLHVVNPDAAPIGAVSYTHLHELDRLAGIRRKGSRRQHGHHQTGYE